MHDAIWNGKVQKMVLQMVHIMIIIKVLVEYLSPDCKLCRSILINFGKACYISDTMLYNLHLLQ